MSTYGISCTTILDNVPKELKEHLIQQVPLKRLADPVEVWQGVRFVIECDYFTGRVLEIDGGLVL
ncbi:hypothetical protein T484DRAFT_1769380 [Baffinella frigidus]|nr:hypothetical protein T484DRAFT_1769380 [Cryptophyta sp. CCMP2293]